MIRSIRGYPLLLILLLLLFNASIINAKPFPVSTDVIISTGDWYPLPEEDMKAAATDTALAELTKGGLFTITPGNKQNKLRLEISLIGPAETAKLTISVNLKDKPTYISTASISVKDMDYQGIYNAFEHIGMVSAQRLNDKTQALIIKPRKDLQSEPVKTDSVNNAPLPNNKKLQALYNQAQSLKRKYQYNQSRILFEQVAAATIKGSDRLNTLAKDELIYGLTVFEAKQSTVAMGNGNSKTIASSLNNAANLYRQILAENSENLSRIQEAQAALDNLSVSQNALKNAFRAQTMSTAHSVRIMLHQQVMMTGECPDKMETMQFISGMHSQVTLINVKKSKTEASYKFTVNNTGSPFELVCSDYEVTIKS